MPQALQPGMRVTLAVGAEPRTQTGDNGADVLEAEVLSRATALTCPVAAVNYLPDASSLLVEVLSVAEVRRRQAVLTSEIVQPQVAMPDEPRTAAGLYWGYTTRIARGVGTIFSECPFEVRGQARTCRRLLCKEPAHELPSFSTMAWVIGALPHGAHGANHAVPVYNWVL